MTEQITTPEALVDDMVVRDQFGDIGVVKAGCVHFPETAPIRVASAIRKYGPLTLLHPLPDAPAPVDVEAAALRVLADHDYADGGGMRWHPSGEPTDQARKVAARIAREVAPVDAEMTTTEWGVRHSQGIRVERSESTAREALDMMLRRQGRGLTPTLVSREVTAWREVSRG